MKKHYNISRTIYSGKNGIFSGIINTNRTNMNTENLIKMFSKYVPVLVEMNKKSLVDLIKENMDTLYNIFNHDVLFSIVSEKLNLQEFINSLSLIRMIYI